MNNCLQCATSTANPKFCSRSCASTYNNSLSPKRKKLKRICKYCPSQVFGRRTVCDLCNPSIVDWSTITLGSLRDKRAFQINSRVRALARAWYKKSGRPMTCALCGYDKHVEICHIVDIQHLAREVTVLEANSPTNTIQLCPNHHWEFDHDLL